LFYVHAEKTCLSAGRKKSFPGVVAGAGRLSNGHYPANGVPINIYSAWATTG